MARVLLVDDDALIQRACSRMLERAGHDVHVEGGAAGARSWLSSHRCDTIVTDLTLPDLSGVAVLESLRSVAANVPIVVITGNPTIESATGAVEHGVYRYLQKPDDTDQLCEVVRGAAGGTAPPPAMRRRTQLGQTFDRAVAGLWLAVQPVIDVATTRVIAYEALMRTNEPALAAPDAFLRAATSLGRLTDLSRATRRAATGLARELPFDASLFVNLHPFELLDEALYERSPFADHAERIVLEITERAQLSQVPDFSARIARLRDLGFRIAVDDLGEGYAGLAALAHLDPDIVKLDMSLVRNVHESAVRRSIVRAMVAVCKGLGRTLVAEGVETPLEREALRREGVRYMQGYLFARPARQFLLEVAS